MIATCRVQLHAGFGLDAAAGILDVLEGLGIDTLYTSPTFAAVPGSTHGYDVVDPRRINPELGGEEAHERLTKALAARGMRRVVDLVPNHMAISPLNRWWWDVLENGRSSRYAHWFDIDWTAASVDRILLPVLGDAYGRVLERGELVLSRRGGSFVVSYYEHQAPIDPGSLGGLLDLACRAAGSDELGFLADCFAQLPPPEQPRRRHRNKEVLKTLLERLLHERPEVARAVDAEIAAVNAEPDRLHALLELQNHRFAHWRTGGQVLDYRRFFDIDHLIGLRTEEREVFDETHALVLDQVRRGEVHGLRIDHPDGLRDPETYFRWLREEAPDAWIVVEKILEPGEELRPSWPVDGTTGYDFLNLVLGLFVDPAAERTLTETCAEFTGRSVDWAEVVREKKRLVLLEDLGSELNRLTDGFLLVCSQHRAQRDHTARDVRRALVAVASRIPVYRTYVVPGRVEEVDRAVVEEAIEGTREDEPELDPELLDFLRAVLLLEVEGAAETDFALTFQQVTGPVMAKGVEDTAFYCFNRLLALNEVGGSPGRFGVSIEAFHRAMQSESLPRRMRALSTHDTKRSEDVRARLSLLSRIPEEWSREVRAWSLHNERHKAGGLPDGNMEYHYYQILVGAWPIEADRAAAYMLKAAREAKENTSWTRPDPEYEAALERFVEATLSDGGFVASLERFVSGLVEPGRAVSLGMLVLQCTVPGIPDRYQGTELWDLSLVDPDNRRPVDWEKRRRLLAELDALSVEQIVARSDEGLPKLHVLRECMHLRRELPEAFEGPYTPLSTEGEDARRCIAFQRGTEVVTVVPTRHLGSAASGGGRLKLPSGRWLDRIARVVHQGTVELDELFGRMPVALLSRQA